MRIFIILCFYCLLISASALVVNFAKEPEDVIVSPGGRAAFHCVPSPENAENVESVIWFKGEKPLRMDGRSRKQLSNGTLLLANIKPRDASEGESGRYRCLLRLLRNNGAMVSREASLTIAYLAPVFDMGPMSTAARLGDSVHFMCRIKSAPHPPQLRWMFAKNRELLPIILQPKRNRFAMHNGGQVLEVLNLTKDQLGLYHCLASFPPHLFGNLNVHRTSQKAQLTLINGPRGSGEMTVPLNFGLAPADVSAVEGSRAELICSANGRAPAGHQDRPNVVWLFNSLTINIGSMPRHSIVGTGSLLIVDVKPEDAGIYTCRASMVGAEDIFSRAELRVLTRPFITPIIPATIRGFLQAELKLSCRVQGSPEPHVTWRKNGELVRNSEYFRLEGQSLRIIGLLPSDSAVYQCIGSNPAGNAHTAVRLIVQHRPTQASTPTGEPLTPPRTPLGLRNVSVWQDNVLLEWQPTGDIMPGGFAKSGKLSYDVIWQKRGHERVRQTNTNHTGYLIPGLSPVTFYDVQVYAVLSPAPGISIRSLHPARLSIRTRAPVAKPLPVRDLRAQAISATSIRVRWRNPADTAKFVPQYLILLYNASDSSSKQRVPQNFTMRPSSLAAGAESTFQVTNLHPYALYRLQVRGVNASGRGVAKEVRQRTMEAKPASAPQNLTIQFQGSRSVTVRWSPLASVERNGEIVAYKLRYKRLDESGQALGKAKAISVSGAKTGHTIPKLERDTPYMVKISARTAVGAGPFSAWKKFRTKANDPDAEFEDRPPGPVEGLDARGLTNIIVLSWFRPDRGRTQVTKYIVHWGELHDEENRRELDGSRLEYTIKGLKPSRNYFVRVDPYNKHGLGKAVYKEVQTRNKPDDNSMPIPMDLRADMIEATTVVLSWKDSDPPDVRRREDRKYEICYYPISGLGRVSPSRAALPGGVERSGEADGDLVDGAPPPGSKWLNATNTRARVGLLRPNTVYEFKVRSVKRSSGGNRRWITSIWSFVQKFTTREQKPSSPPLDLTLTSLRDELRSVKLAWQPPAHPNGQIRYYVVYFTADRSLPKDEWVQRLVKGSLLNFKVTTLDRDLIYFFQIRAKNRKGAGPFSPIRLFKTPDENGKFGGPLHLPDIYDIQRIPSQKQLLRKFFKAEQEAGKGDAAEDSASGLGDHTWWIIIGCVFSFAILLIVIILIFICVCRPGANRRMLVRKRNSDGYKLGSKVPDCDGTLGEAHGKVTPLPPPSLKPPDLFTGHRPQPGEHQHYEMERRDSESGSDSMRFQAGQGGQAQVTNGGLIGPHGQMGRAHVRIGSQGQPIKPKPMLLPVQDAMQPPPREPVAMVTAIGGPGMGRGMVAGPNGVISGPTPFMRGQFAMAGPAGPPGPAAVPGPRVNASDIASQPSSEELQPLMSSSQISQPGMKNSGSPFHGSASSKGTSKPLRPAPVLAEGTDSASEISRGYSTEKLNQEMANLEGLMKDLNAMTQKEFEC